MDPMGYRDYFIRHYKDPYQTQLRIHQVLQKIPCLVEGDSPSYLPIARWLLVAFVDDTSDQQDLPILTAFNGVFHKKCATAEQKRCMQYVFIFVYIYIHIYICTKIVKSPVDFLEFWVGDGSVGFLRLATFWVFWGSMTWALYCKPRNHQNSLYSFIQPSNHWDKPKQSQRTHHQETLKGIFFHIPFYPLRLHPPKKHQKKHQKPYPFPPRRKNNRSSKQKTKSTPTTVPPGDSSRDLFIPWRSPTTFSRGHVFTITKRAQKNCQAQRTARWFEFRLNPLMKGIVSLGVALKSQTTNRAQTDNYPPWT